MCKRQANILLCVPDSLLVEIREGYVYSIPVQHICCQHPANTQNPAKQGSSLNERSHKCFKSGDAHLYLLQDNCGIGMK